MTIFVDNQEWQWTAFAILAMFSFFLRKSSRTSIVPSQFLNPSPLSLRPLINSGRHTSHLKDSGRVAFTKVQQRFINIFNSRASLYNVGLGKDDRYLCSRSTEKIALYTIPLTILLSKGGGGKHWRSKHVWYGRHCREEEGGDKSGKTSDCGSCLRPQVKIFACLEFNRIWVSSSQLFLLLIIITY